MGGGAGGVRGGGLGEGTLFCRNHHGALNRLFRSRSTLGSLVLWLVKLLLHHNATG